MNLKSASIALSFLLVACPAPQDEGVGGPGPGNAGNDPGMPAGPNGGPLPPGAPDEASLARPVLPPYDCLGPPLTPGSYEYNQDLREGDAAAGPSTRDHSILPLPPWGVLSGNHPNP